MVASKKSVKKSKKGGIKSEEKAIIDTFSNDWVKLKTEFLLGSWDKVDDFIKDKKIEISDKILKKLTRGWASEKKRMMKGIMRLVEARIAREYADEIYKAKKRQIKLAKKFQKIASKGIKKYKNRNLKLSDIIKLGQLGIELEQKALTLTVEKNVPKALTQVNVNFPKTRFNEMLEEMSHEELIKLLAEIKRKRASGVRASGEGKSSGEAK